MTGAAAVLARLFPEVPPTDAALSDLLWARTPPGTTG
jgi:hypothetical protein